MTRLNLRLWRIRSAWSWERGEARVRRGRSAGRVAGRPVGGVHARAWARFGSRGEEVTARVAERAYQPRGATGKNPLRAQTRVRVRLVGACPPPTAAPPPPPPSNPRPTASR